MSLSIVILAAGQGTRMRSALAKVLHPLAGRPLLEHVLAAASALNPDDMHVVYGHGGDHVREAMATWPVSWVEQAEQLGTGHAVQQVLPHLPDEHTVLVLYGDVPLIQSDTLKRLIERAGSERLALLTVELRDPAGYGRIVRSAKGHVMRIVEHKDANDEQRRIREINTGILAVPAPLLRKWLQQLRADNAQGEYYLTDIIEMAVADQIEVVTSAPSGIHEVMGVNDKQQLSELERFYQRAKAQNLMRQGVTLIDPERFDLRGELTVGQDVSIDINAVLVGDVRLGDRVSIGPNVIITDSQLGDDVEVLANTVIERAVIGSGSRIGPFARVRPDTELADHVHVGNFVEIKKSSVASGSKINHLSYVGDATVGKNVNIGAGTITCNYDGANKHRTIIEDNVFVGSDTQLVAPVTVGAGATIGAGSTITRDAPAGELTLSRAKQTVKSGWNRPTKDKT